jgi:D-alanyl-lipoteichoic acid acyltransferase DltB (MBOAT superfamily)
LRKLVARHAAMIFNSLTFVLFLLIVFSLYWLLDRRRQNVLLLVASYVFYGWWDWRFLSLILASSLWDYWLGQRIDTAAPGRKKRWLMTSILTNLGLLGLFKYFNFFADSFVGVARALGFEAGFTTLHIILPVGISFYTFQSLSYTIDVYRGQCAPHRNLVEFLAYVAFFPQLVAGPIERATHLLGQFSAERTFDVEKAKDGVRQMLWGYFQKIVIADGLADYVNNVYGRLGQANGGELLLATYFFAIQIYCDFAGYTNIAIGCARLFGFGLMRNFAYPYFSRNIAEFWQRWHISLSTWFRDYLYIPLGGNRGAFRFIVFNVLVTFTVSGLWHGANWTFVVWGLLNGLYFIPVLFLRRYRGEEKGTARTTAGLRDLGSIVLTFHLTLFAWIFFRAESLGQAGQIIGAIAGTFDLKTFLIEGLKLKLLIALMLAIEWAQRDKQHPLEIGAFPAPARWLAYNAVGLVILFLGTFKYTPFIYFQF